MVFIDNEARSHISGLAKLVVQCYLDTIVVNQNVVFLINICAKNLLPQHVVNDMGKAK